MARGGNRSGAGRPKGAANKFSEAARAEAAAEGITPLEYMLAVLRDETIVRQERMDAAKAAAPYMHSRLESIKHSGDEENPIHIKSESDVKFGAVVGALEGAARAKSGGAGGEGGVDNKSKAGTANA